MMAIHQVISSLLVPTTCSNGVPVGNVPDQNCSHLECSGQNNLYVQTCTKGVCAFVASGMRCLLNTPKLLVVS